MRRSKHRNVIMTKTTSDIISIIFFLVLMLLIIVFGPLAILWSLNTLFPVLAIPYNFWSWLAVIIMNVTWMSNSIIKKDN